jgi:hypothetical protein
VTHRLPSPIIGLLLLVASLTACAGTNEDACDALTLAADARCMSYRVTGDFGPVDNLQVDVELSEAPTRLRVYRVTSTPMGLADGGSVEPPLSFAISMGADTVPSKIRVVAKLGATPVAYGFTALDLAPGDRQSAELALDGDIVKTRCFDNKQDGTEIATDCEGDSAFAACPFCTIGQACDNDLACANSVCDAITNLCKAFP